MQIKNYLITILIFLNFTIIGFSQNFAPNNLSNLLIWFSADSVLLNGDTVITWYDLSGNNNHASQNDNLRRPVLNSVPDTLFNFEPTIKFDGINDVLITPDILTGQQFTCFVLFKANSFFNVANPVLANKGAINSEWVVFFSGSLMGWRVILQDIQKDLSPPGKPYLVQFGISNNASQLYIDTALATSLNVSNPPSNNTPIYFGNSDGNNPFQGEIAEIIIYDTALSTNNKVLVEKYFIDKYAPPVNLGSDIYASNLCPITLNASNKYISYLWSTTANNPSDTLSTITINNPGQYFVTVTNIFGIESIDTINVYTPFNEIHDTIICQFSFAEFSTGLSHLYDFVWSTSSTDSIITISNQDQYWVSITDSLSCSIMDSFFVSIDSFPITANLGSDTSLCSGNSITLKTGASEAISYLWNDNSTNSSLIINTTGNYWVSVTNINGCIATDTIHVNIQGSAPVPLFTNTPLCFGVPIVFTDNSYTLDSSNIISWQWVLNSDTINTQNFSQIFSVLDTFNIQLTVVTDSNCANTYASNVIIHPNPVANYNIAGTCNGSISFFNNLSAIPEGYFTSMDWDFGDNSTSALLNPQHSFSDVGYYPVQLIATTNNGCKDTVIKNIEIKPKPDAGYDFSPACMGYATYFFDTSEVINVLPIIEWKWSFGDGGVSSQQNPQHVYISMGNYNCTLIVQSLNGCFDTIANIVSVSEPPVSGFIGDSTCYGISLHCNDTSAGIIYKWKWMINSNVVSALQNPNLDFNLPGDYSVKLIVTSTDDCTDSVSKIVTVYPLPWVDFELSSTIGPPGMVILATNESDTGNYFWQFGDSQTSQLFSPSHSYTDTGMYTVWLEVEDFHGCMDSVSQDVKIVLPIYNLAIMDIISVKNNDYRNTTATIANVGTLPIINPLLILYSNKHTPIMEVYSDTIFSGQIVNYEFTSQLPVADNQDPDYLCVKGQLGSGLTDADVSNNEACEILQSKGLILSLYPNPTSSTITIDLGLTLPGKAQIQIFDKIGRKLTENEFEVMSGFNRISIDVKDYAKGKYNIQLTTPEGKESMEFVKN